MKRYFWYAALVSTLLAPAVFTPGAAQTRNEEIKLGALLHVTGDFAMQGAAFREGAELAVEEINKSGGVKGQKLKLILEDTRYDSKLAHTGAKKLLNIDKVSGALIATITEAKSAGPLFARKEVPLIVLWDSSEELEKMGDSIFGIGTWVPSTGERAAEFSTAKLAAKRAIVINTNNGWSLTISKAFSKKFTELGGAVLEEFSLNPGMTDFRTVIMKAKKLNPDVLYAPVDDNIISFFKQLKELKFGAPVITADNLNAEVIGAASEALEGVYQTQTADPGAAETQKMMKLYEKRYRRKATMPLFISWGYDAVQLLAASIESAGPQPEQIARELYTFQDYPGASGTISINEKGSSPKYVSVFQVQESQLKMVN